MSAVAATVLLTLAVTAVPERDRNGLPHLRSESVVVRVADSDDIVLAKNADVVRPIASVTKLLSGLVLSQLGVDGAASVTIGEEDKDRRKWSRSRLFVGLTAPWSELIRAALSASDNRAMYATVRVAAPRGDFVALMNDKARALGMSSSRFVDAAGVDAGNVSTATDLLALLEASAASDSVRAWSSATTIELAAKRGSIVLRNPDRLLHSDGWDIVVGKTGYTVEAGRCFAVRAEIAGHPVDMVFLGSREMASVFGDAGRVRRWLEPRLERVPALMAAEAPASTGAVR